MAYTVRINRIATAVQSREAGARLVRQVLYEVEFFAKAVTLGGSYSSGALADSIHSVGPTFDPRGVTGRVGSKLKYAMSVHDGAKVHWIFPKGIHRARFGGRPKRPMLKFYWRKVGKVVWMNQVPGSRGKIGVSHPGQPGKKYLTRGLVRSAHLHNMRVETLDL
jgi:hypothetical protein